jgi:hypothetical protein
MACRRTRKLWGHWGVLASTVTLTLLLLAIPGVAQAASADIAGVAKVAVPAAPAVPGAATTAASAARSIAASTTAHVAAAVPAAQPAADAVASVQAIAQKVTSASAASSPPTGTGSGSGAPTAAPAASPPAASPGSGPQSATRSEPIADTIVRRVETAVSGAIGHAPDVARSPLPSRIKAIVADPVALARTGTPVTVVAPSRSGGRGKHDGSWRGGPRSGAGPASRTRGLASAQLLRPAVGRAAVAGEHLWNLSVSPPATGVPPGATAPPATDAARSPGPVAGHLSAGRDRPRAVARTGRVEVASPIDWAAPATAAVAPGGSEGTSSGVGAGTSAAAAAILGLAGLWLLRALLPGLLTLDIFPWQSTLRAMRLERPG